MTSSDQRAALPPVVFTVTLTRMLMLRLSIYGIALCYPALAIVLSMTEGEYHIGSLRDFGVTCAVGAGAAIATIMLHEAVHGLFFRIYGGRPRYGIGCIGGVMPYAYATVPGMPFTLRQMTVIGLAPFVLLSTAAFGALWFAPSVFGVAAVAFVTNVSGSIGDLWVTTRMWRFRHCRDLALVDARDAMCFHTDDPRGATIAAAMSLDESGSVITRFGVRAIAATSVIALAVMPLGIVLSMLNAPDVTLGPSPLPIVVYRTMGGHGLSIELGGPGLIMAGLACAAVSMPLRRRGRTRPDSPSGVPRPAFL